MEDHQALAQFAQELAATAAVKHSAGREQALLTARYQNIVELNAWTADGVQRTLRRRRTEQTKLTVLSSGDQRRHRQRLAVMKATIIAELTHNGEPNPLG